MDHNHPRYNFEVDQSDDKKISKFRAALPQFLAVGVKNVLLFGYGMTLGFPTIVIPAIQGGEGRDPSGSGEIVLSRDEISWFSSINLICVPLGCIFSGAFTQPIGKRMAMQIVNIPILLAWLFFYFSTNIYHLYVGLCLAGLSGGLMEAPVLTYVAEVTDPKYRGMLAASGSTFLILGVFTQFLMGTLMTWRTIAACSTAIPVISIILLFFVPESPYWLIKKRRFEKARQSIAWLRGWVHVDSINKDFQELFDLITYVPPETQRDKDKSPLMKKLNLYMKKSFLVPYGLVSLTFFCGHFSGKTPLQTYAVQIFNTLKAPVDKYYATFLLGMAELLGTILCVILVHFTGKRPLVLISTIGCGLCFLGTATYAKFLDLVPGVTVDNVVANVSYLDLDKSKVISVTNVTDLFESVRPLSKNRSRVNTEIDNKIMQFGANYTTEINEFETTELTETTWETTTMLLPVTEIMNNRIIRSFTELITTTDITDDMTTLFEDENTEVITTDIPIVKEDNTIKKIKDNIPDEVILEVPKIEKNVFLWLPLTLLLLSAVFSHAGIRLIPWMLIGEVFPTSVRSGASGISGGTGYLFGFLANKLFLKMLATMTLPGTFWFYSSVSLVGALILYFILPETEGRSLVEIEQHFSGIKRLEKKKRRTCCSRKSSKNNETTNQTTARLGDRIFIPNRVNEASNWEQKYRKRSRQEEEPRSSINNLNIPNHSAMGVKRSPNIGVQNHGFIRD